MFFVIVFPQEYTAANDFATAECIKCWLRLRHQLFPYIYTMNYRCHKDLSPLVQPMYYMYPKCEAAYHVPNQFWFGTELMVAPITTPGDKIAHMGKVNVWMPDGEWFDFFTGMHYRGLDGRMITVCRPTTTMPVFAKAGAIVPLANYTDNCLCSSDDMEVLVFPGADNVFTLISKGIHSLQSIQGQRCILDSTPNTLRAHARTHTQCTHMDTSPLQLC